MNGGRTIKLTHLIRNIFCFNGRETLINHKGENIVAYELQNEFLFCSIVTMKNLAVLEKF